jgi:hypothetical protein
MIPTNAQQRFYMNHFMYYLACTIERMFQDALMLIVLKPLPHGWLDPEVPALVHVEAVHLDRRCLLKTYAQKLLNASTVAQTFPSPAIQPTFRHTPHGGLQHHSNGVECAGYREKLLADECMMLQRVAMNSAPTNAESHSGGKQQ